jgi:hypothetical protein
MQVNIYIGFWTLKVKCIQYGICEEVVIKNARAMVFSKSSGAGGNFQSGPENLDFFVGQLPLAASTSPERLVGVRILSAITNITLYEEDIHDNYTIGTHKPKAVNA